MPLGDSLTLCTKGLVIIIRGQGNGTLKGHVLPVLCLASKSLLVDRELGAEELVVQMRSPNCEGGS